MAKIFKKNSGKILVLTALAVGLSNLVPTYLRAENIDEKTTNLEVGKIQEQENPKDNEEQEKLKDNEEQEEPKVSEEQEIPKDNEEQEKLKDNEEQEEPKASEEQENPKDNEEQEEPKANQEVYFEDDNLRKYIVDLLNDSSYRIEGREFSENSEVYKPKMEDLELLQKFDGLGKSQIDLGEVKSFKGLENAINIKEIRIFTSNLRDLNFISNMNDLEILYLSSNNIYSIDSISKLSNLRTLSIHSKNLSNYDPISNLGSLEELDITDVSLKNIGFLSNLSNLKSLTLYSNEIESIKDLKDLSKLEELIINNNKIENLEGIENLKKLKKLILSYNNLTDIKGIENLTDLEYFEVEKNRVISVKELENLTNLKHVTIRGNLVADASPFSNLLNLEYLHLYENQIEDISMLANLSKLKEFNFSKNKVSDASVVSNYKELVNLHARENLITNIDFLIPLINDGSLDTVNISENPILDLTVLSKIDDSKIKEKKTGIVIDKQKINIKLDKSNINKINGKYFVELENPIKLPDGTYGKFLKETADFDFEYSTKKLKDDRLIINLGESFEPSSEIVLYASFSFPKLVPGFSEDWEWTENGPEKVISYGCNFDGDVFFTGESSNHAIDKDKYQEVNFKNDEFRKYIVTSLNNGEFRYFGNPFNENPDNYLPLVYNMRALRTLDWNETSGIDYSKIKDLSGLEYSLFLENLDISTGYVEDISSIKNLRKLMTLNIANNPISSIDILSNFRNLTYVDLSNTKVTDLSPLEKLPNLFAINASGCNIENFGNISEFVEIEGLDRPKDDNSSEKDKDTSKEDKDKNTSKEDKDKNTSREDKDENISREDKDKNTSREDKDKNTSREDKDENISREDKDKDTKKENKKDRDYIKDYTFKVEKPMSDLENYYGKDAIVRLQEKGILKGFSDGTFRPNNSMTRAELAVVLNRIFKLDKKELTLEFKDTDQSWYEEAIEILSSNHIIFGSKGSFRPNNNITREEMLTMFIRCIDKFETVSVKEKLQFKDVDQISDWAYPYLEKAYSLNLVKGSENWILPRNHITRGEVALILDRFLD